MPDRKKPLPPPTAGTPTSFELAPSGRAVNIGYCLRMMKTGEAIFLPIARGSVNAAVTKLKRLGYHHTTRVVVGGTQIWCMFAPAVEMDP